MSCGKYRIFPCTLSSFRQCAEHLGELLQRSWVKPKLLSRPAPRASPFYPQHSSPARRVSLNQSQNKQTHIGFRVLPLALPSRNPRLHNNGAETYGPTGATRTQQLCERDEVCTHQSWGRDRPQSSSLSSTILQSTVTCQARAATVFLRMLSQYRAGGPPTVNLTLTDWGRKHWSRTRPHTRACPTHTHTQTHTHTHTHTIAHTKQPAFHFSPKVSPKWLGWKLNQN